jgi:PAS domain S-box-containing protein
MAALKTILICSFTYLNKGWKLFLKSTNKIIAMLALAALTIGIAMSASFWSFNQIKEASEARQHIYLVISNADNLLSELKDAETGQRGYLLTGDEAFLEPYLLAKSNIVADLNRLFKQTKIQSARQYLGAIGPLVDARMAELARLIDLRRSKGMNSAAEEVRKGRGKELMDSIRIKLGDFTKVEKSAAAQLEIKLQSTLRRMFNIIIIAGLLCTLFALAFIYLIYRQSQQKLKNLVHLETKHLLLAQEDTNKQLQQINATLEETQERLLVTLNSIGDAVIATDKSAKVTLLNPLAQKLTGWTQLEAAGRPVNEILHIFNQDTRKPIKIPIDEALASGIIQSMTNHTVLVARGGGECIIADSCAPILDRDNHVVGAILVFRDVSQDYAAKQILRDNTARIQTILNTVADGVITFHANGGMVETVNPAAEKMFGFSAAELIGKNFSILIPELDQTKRDGSLDYYSASAKEMAVGHGREVIGWHKDNSSFALEVAVSEMLLGSERYFTAILRDITVRKKAEIERTRLDEILQDKNTELERATLVADKANLAKSDFLSNMSHELRTPLGAILGFAQLIESGTPIPTPSQKKSIDQILKAGWYLLDLINEILDLALIESGKMTLSLEPVSLAEIMRECKAMIEPQAEKRDIALTFNQLETPYFVKADHIRVKQVLINLLSNAIKYNKTGGTVTIDYTLTGIDSVRINVRDTGEGLSQALISQLFQPFNRLGQNAKAEVGTGIGLVVCKRLVELMQGRIGVESVVGEGSVFWVELDLIIGTRPEDQTQILMQKEYADEGKLHTLLYVEDNPANLMLVEDIIARRPDIRLLSAKNGKQGIKLARTMLPDIILMDINLPDINGLDAMKILAKDSVTAHIPVIALSANAIPHDIEKGLQAGFFHYLTKPIKVSIFLDTLDVAIKYVIKNATASTKKIKPKG